VQAREGQLHLGLYADGTDDPVAVGAGTCVIQEGRLPGTGFAAQHQDAALARPSAGQQPIEVLTLGSAIDELASGVSHGSTQPPETIATTGYLASPRERTLQAAPLADVDRIDEHVHVRIQRPALVELQIGDGQRA
jgi:hypothetical protein